MIKIELDGTTCIACETDVSNYESSSAVEEAAIEIKTAMFLAMADEFVKLVKMTGQKPSVVAETMIEIIGCREEDFSEFIDMLVEEKSARDSYLA